MNKEKLPKNWFKRFSRRKHRGREYYYNNKTKEKSWEHPNANIANGSVLKWLIDRSFNTE